MQVGIPALRLTCSVTLSNHTPLKFHFSSFIELRIMTPNYYWFLLKVRYDSTSESKEDKEN